MHYLVQRGGVPVQHHLRMLIYLLASYNIAAECLPEWAGF